ncbi:hypothetical protein Ccrd_020468 [Cynara cardunculus var. scolymus]|uniref:Uncharacterized protein n=1 Tax=Cynara cardunculus var. scolymus TaxID=59895 RepID=A0A103Y2D6_CYNCS|nr:hypothetical protein Ccrd_020468 [Cynara cardunculus var. scolymus]
MGDEKSPVSRDRELLIPVANTVDDDDGASSKPSPSSNSSSHHAGRETFSKVVRSWASKKFMTGCVILLPIAITFYITWWFIHFVDGFFSPIYVQLGIDIFEKMIADLLSIADLLLLLVAVDYSVRSSSRKDEKEREWKQTVGVKRNCGIRGHVNAANTIDTGLECKRGQTEKQLNLSDEIT